MEAGHIKKDTFRGELMDNSKFKCEELDLPETLNTERYLGRMNESGRQQIDFHVIERFRVDNMRNGSSGHAIFF